jgi:CheY-like chemotaxis protein
VEQYRLSAFTAAADPTVSNLSKPAASARKLRIVVADDNQDTADALSALFEIHGYEVVTVYDGEAALRAVIEHLPDFGFFDIGMPKLNGYEVARAVRLAQVDTFLVAISGWGTACDVRRAKDSGFQQHFTKPASFSDLQAIIRLFSA